MGDDGAHHSVFFPTYDVHMHHAQSCLLNLTMHVSFTVSVKHLTFVLEGWCKLSVSKMKAVCRRSLITALDATPPNYVYKRLYYIYVHIYIYVCI